MALVKRTMTPEQWADTVRDISRRLTHTRVLRRRFGMRWQRSLKRNITSGKNANNTPMARLKEISYNANVVADDDETILGERARFGSKVMKATGRMQKGLSYLLIKDGLIIANRDRQRQEVSGYHTKDVRMIVSPKMQRHLAGLHNIFIKVGSVIFRPARIPFALNSRQVKRSVRELNAFIFRKLLKRE